MPAQTLESGTHTVKSRQTSPERTHRSLQHIAAATVVALAYVIAGKLGLTLAFVNPSATAVWPPTGIALAALLILGRQVWPGIFLGAFLTNQLTAGSWATSLLIAGGNTLEALVGAYLINRFSSPRPVFNRGRDIFTFTLLAGFASTISATVGVTSLAWFGFASWAAYGAIWLTWWLGDTTGAIVFAPVILLWSGNLRLQWSRSEQFELLFFFVALVTVGWIVFVAAAYPLSFLCIPLCAWAGLRLGQREAATAMCLLSLIAVWGSAQGLGAFGQRTPNESLLLVQGFMAVAIIVGLTVGATVFERRRAEYHLRRAHDELDLLVNSRTHELRAALDQLRASEARFAEAQQVANVGSWEWNLLDNTEYWSAQLYRIFGVEPNSFTPSFETFSQFLHPDDRERVSAVVQRTLADHQPFECDNRIVRPDCSVRSLHVQGRVAINDAGQVIRLLGTAQDITARKATEEIVSRSERRLQAIVDAQPACVKLVSPDGLLLEMNRAGLEMLDAESIDGLVGRPVIDLIHPEDRGQFVEMHVAASSGSPTRGEFRIVGLEGRERWVDSHLVPFDLSTSQSDAKLPVLSVTSDITEHKRLEGLLRQGLKLEAVGSLAGGIAHDFNNLLTAISGYTDLVVVTMDDTDSRRVDLLEVRKAAERAATLTRQLLAFSRRQVLQTKVLDLNALVADVHKLLRRTIPEHIDLVLDLDSVLDPIRADPGQLEQVLLNLAVNAADAMPQGGQLRFSTKVVDVDEAWARRYPPMTEGRFVRLTVSDSGTGMSADTQARIFEPFFTTKERGKGTGLGLATVYGIVKQSGGFIWVTSELQRGTTFEIYLPVVHESIDSAEPISTVAEPQGGTETILLAEDDGAVRRLAGKILSRYGYHVLEARDGDEALSVAERYDGDIDMLMTDVVMPGLSGRDLADKLAQMRPGIHVLYTSGYTENVTIKAGLERGLPLLAKPYPPTALLKKVREILDNQNAAHVRG